MAELTAHDYIRQLAATLDLAAEFRVPCPGHPLGPFADLKVEKRLDGHGDGWAIALDDNIWTGTRWEHRGVLTRSEIYRYTRDAALAEAQRIAPLETERHHALIRSIAPRPQENPHG
ncbi:hypothetical protein [Streptomyces sp. NPDC056069]|uniref:hypothetical protein n=1 Tax=Streptomyces sp. NPDC056069 TaxID=3345702 RepID=UPI0035E3A8BA